MAHSVGEAVPSVIWDQVVEFLAEPSTWSGSNSIPVLLWEHVWISVASTLLALVLVFPPALWLGHNRRGADLAGALVNIGRAVPSFGILVLSVMVMLQLGVSVLSPWGVMVALVALAAPPIFTNTIAGVQGVSRATVESARGMGMLESQLIRRVEMPLASPVILEGIRIAFVQVIATATLGALVAWGGLGRLIVDGFSQQNQGKLLTGAILVALLAVIAEVGLAVAQRASMPQGLRAARE
ncbi:MAG TPA: ABC transporter permease [Acidimicrobiia bacterium]|jgi:osmoprotectant transport system permease protein|nr:ABC transporter permease [Acidimicrobiia bacterium]